MPNSTCETAAVPYAPLKPLPEHLFDAVVASLRASLGAGWGQPGEDVRAALRSIRKAVSEQAHVYIATEPGHDEERGVTLQLWVDHDGLDVVAADDIVSRVLRSPGDREILVVCRSFAEDGLYYRFASGSVDAGLIGTIGLVGPYARDLAQLTRLSSGQPLGFSA